MKLLVLLYIGVLGVAILGIGAHYVHARVVEARCVVDRLQIQSRLRRRNNGHEDLSRISPVVDAHNLRGCGIGLYGGGSLGSWVAYFLSPLVGQIRVIDSDIVEPSNVAGGRTIYSKSHLGMAKSVALKQVLEGASPHLRVLAYQEDINKLSTLFFMRFWMGILLYALWMISIVSCVSTSSSMAVVRWCTAALCGRRPKGLSALSQRIRRASGVACSCRGKAFGPCTASRDWGWTSLWWLILWLR